MKRTISTITIFACVASFLLPTLRARAADIDASAGDLIKNESLSAVYYYAADGNRYTFPNEKTYFTWYDDFDDVVTISDDQLADVPLVGVVTYKPGVRMVKIESDPKVYAVAGGAVLRWVTTEEIVTSLYGSAWNTYIDDIPVAFWPHYSFGNDIASDGQYSKDEEEAGADSIQDELDAVDDSDEDSSGDEDDTDDSSDDEDSDDTDDADDSDDSEDTDDEAVYDMVLIGNVPDGNQPPTNSFLLGDTNFCAPISAANVTEYWDTVIGDSNADDVNADLNVVETVADWIGFFMNTNDVGSIDRNSGLGFGTPIINIASGIIDWTIWDGVDGSDYEFDDPWFDLAGKEDYTSWDIETISFDDVSESSAWTLYINEIDAGQPPVVSFEYWNPQETTFDDLENSISFYTWGDEIDVADDADLSPDEIEEKWYTNSSEEYSTGHAVTGVGYIQDYDMGDGVSRDWAIVHDNWDTTAENIAVPWENWSSTTSIDPEPNTVPEIPEIDDPGDFVTIGDDYDVTWESVRGAKNYCIDWDISPGFESGLGACTYGGSNTEYSFTGTTDEMNWLRQDHFYRVKACNDMGCSDWSEIVDMVVLEIDPIVVPDDYLYIQQALNSASAGDTVYVKDGVHEMSSMTMPDAVYLIGESVENTIVEIYDNIGVTTGDYTLIMNITFNSDDGTMFYVSGVTSSFLNVLFEAESSQVIQVTYGGDLYVYNSTLYSTGAYGGIWTDIEYVNSVDIVNTIVQGFRYGLYVQGSSIGTSSYSNVFGTDDSMNWYGNIVQDSTDISTDSMFVDESGRDYRLSDSSPCIDAGQPSMIYNDVDGTVNDMGAFGGAYGW